MGAAQQVANVEQPARSKRHILIRDDLYAKVAYEASLEKSHTGEVVDKALAFYFEHSKNKI